MINDRVVYESPDGGHTVYARRFGEVNRTLVYQSPNAVFQSRMHKWKGILEVSSKYPALDDAVKQAELIYEIVKKENQN